MAKPAPQDSFWTRARRATRYVIRGLYQEITNKNLFLWGQAIAFKVLITIVPVLILATGLIGRLLRSEQPFQAIAQIIRDFLPPTQSEQIINFLADLHGASGTLTLIGAVGLFLSAVSLFITLRITVSKAFEKDWHVSRSLLRGYLFDVRMVIQVGLLFFLTIGFSIAARSIGPSTALGWLGMDYPWALTGWQRVLNIVGLLTPFLITTAMFFQLYYFVPKPRPRPRSALLGSLVTSVLWEAAKYAFTYYATYVGFGDYADAGLTALSNAFGLLIAFVFWVYFSSIVFLLGAVLASLHEHWHRLREEERAAAQESSDSDAASPAENESTSHAPDTNQSDAPVSDDEPARQTRS